MFVVFWIVMGLFAAIGIALLVVTTVQRRQLRDALERAHGAIFDFLWCNQDGTHALAFSAHAQALWLATREAGRIEQRKIGLETIADIALVEHHGRWTPVDGVWIALHVRVGTGAHAEDITVPALVLPLTPKTADYRRVLRDAGQTCERLQRLLKARRCPPPVAAEPEPPATAFPGHAQTPRTPRVPTVQPGR